MQSRRLRGLIFVVPVAIALVLGSSAANRFADPDTVEVDVAMFERRVAEGTPQALEEAAKLYRGDLFLGFRMDEPLFEEWLAAERQRFWEMALQALARLLAHQATDASTERAIQTGVRLVALDPLQEATHRALMRLYARQGRRSAALKQYYRTLPAQEAGPRRASRERNRRCSA